VANPTIPFDYRRSHVTPGKGRRYDATYASGRALALYWDHFERPFLEERFARFANRGTPVRYLDFASGTGRILDVAARHFDDLTGIDVSEAMVEVAREKVPTARIIRADVTSEEVDVGSFDVITLFRFILRARDLRDDVLDWLRSVVRDDGVLIVNNHRNAYSIRGLVYRLSHAFRHDGTETELLTDHQVEALMQRAGFAVSEAFGFGILPSIHGRLLLPARVVLRLERRLLRSRLAARFAKNRIYVCTPIVGAARVPAEG
jgi:SAM-dependent methyltransferase